MESRGVVPARETVLSRNSQVHASLEYRHKQGFKRTRKFIRGKSRGRFCNAPPYKIMAVIEEEREKIAVPAAFGYKLEGVMKWINLSFGKDYPGLETFTRNSIPHNMVDAAPKSLSDGYYCSDVQFGLRFVAALADVAGIDVPVIRSTVTLTGRLNGQDFFSTGRRLATYGLVEGETTVKDVLHLFHATASVRKNALADRNSHILAGSARHAKLDDKPALANPMEGAREADGSAVEHNYSLATIDVRKVPSTRCGNSGSDSLDSMID
ncbi:hypothetical protein B0H11DRAFT_1910789 [Mycena galericulata]|nr:hypothetical protein B0H11DRAFT_1910789 [Mycena galericulata]